MRKKVIVILILAVFCFQGCSKKQSTDKARSMPASGGLIREDADGLVRVRISEGVAELTLDLDKWDSKYKAFSDGKKKDYAAGPFTIETREDSAIKDACAGTIRNLSLSGDRSVPIVYVVLLMENGAVEYVRVQPYQRDSSEPLQAWGPLLWLRDITALSYENGTVCATGKDGAKNDVYIPVGQPGIGRKSWGLELFKTANAIIGDYFGEINFTSPSKMSYEIRGSEGNLIYSGNYEFILSSGHKSGYPANTLVVELEKDYDSRDIYDPDALDPRPMLDGQPRAIKAAYSVELDDSDAITLKHIDGGHLFNSFYRGNQQEVYKMESLFDGDPTIYPYELVGFLSGEWEYFNPGENGAKLNIFSSDFGHYDRDFAFGIYATGKKSSGFPGYLEGGLSSSQNYYYTDKSGKSNSMDLSNSGLYALTFHFYDNAIDSETYTIRDAGTHKGKRLMLMSKAIGTDHSEIEKTMINYGLIGNNDDGLNRPIVFAKNASEVRAGRRRLNETFYVRFWEFDNSKKIIWVTEEGLTGSDPTCASVDYKLNGVNPRDYNFLRPGMDFEVTTNAKGEIVKLSFSEG